jgi:hypothetical protein
VLLETSATITDEILDLNDRLLGSLFAKAKRQFESAFQDAGRAINDKVRLYAKIGQALIEAKTSQSDPFLAIESIVPWERFTQTVAEAEQPAQSEDFDYLGFLGDSYPQLRRYHCAKSDASNGPSLPSNGCKAPICAAAGFRSV